MADSSWVPTIISTCIEVGKLLTHPVTEHLSYLLCLSSFHDGLLEKTKSLELAQARLLGMVKSARSNNEEIEQDVQTWLDDVAEILSRKATLLNEIKQRKGCFTYQLSKKINDTTIQVSNLQMRYPSAPVGHRVDHPPIEFSQVTDFNIPPSWRKPLDDIMDSLKSTEVNMIGLYGMGGVGKTTLVRHIGKIAKHNKLFDRVLMVDFTLKQDTLLPDIKKIQDKIASELNLNIEAENNETWRASRLLSRLRQEKNILIVLDNVCDYVGLREIGMEYVDTSRNRCKYIMTTRDFHICNLMCCEKTVRLDIMTESEAYALLKDKTGLDHDDDDDSPRADTVFKAAKKCGGLPIAIVTLASALKDKGKANWETALNRLNKSKLLEIDHIDRKINTYTCFESSYHQLNNKDLKLCFILCSLFPEDYAISREDLTRLATTELDGNYSIEEKRISVEASIATLVAKSLLLKTGGEREYKVKMHYMVRHFALSILSKPENFFTGTYISESTGFPADDVLASFMGISIMEKQHKELQRGQIYRKLRVLLVRGQNWKPISKDIFKDLTNLRVLLLEECELLNDLSSLKYLKNIEILSFRGSSITQLHDGISEMQFLKLLDVSHCRNRLKVSRGLLKKLLNLEELYTHGSSWNLWGKERGDFRVSDLNALTRLNRLSFDFHYKNLPKGFVFPTLKWYSIYMGSNRHNRGVDLRSNTLIFENVGSTWQKVFHNLLPTVNHLHFRDCRDLRFLVNTTGLKTNAPIFSSLAKLELKSLPDLRCLWEGPTPRAGLLNLTEICIDECHKLTFVFSESLAQSLVQLQALKIHNCNGLQRIILEEECNVTSLNHNQIRSFRKLGRLEITSCHKLKYIMSISVAKRLEKLEYLKENYNSELKQIFGHAEEKVSSGEIVLSSLQELEVERCAEREMSGLLKGKHLSRLTINRRVETWYAVLPMLVKQKPTTLKHIKLSWVYGLHQMFHLEGKGHGKEQPHLIVSIESLELADLPNLRDIWSGCIYTPNLTHLDLHNCHSLGYIFSPTSARNLPLLKVLKISLCDKLDAIIGEDIHKESDRPKPKYFTNIEHISISKCKKLKYIFPVSVVRAVLSKMRRVELKSNKELEGVFEGEKEVDDPNILELPLLTDLILYDLPEMKSFCPVGYHFIFPCLNASVNICDKVARTIRVASDGSVHAESKGLNEDLSLYVRDGSSSSRPDDPRTSKCRFM